MWHARMGSGKIVIAVVLGARDARVCVHVSMCLVALSKEVMQKSLGLMQMSSCTRHKVVVAEEMDENCAVRARSELRFRSCLLDFSYIEVVLLSSSLNTL